MKKFFSNLYQSKKPKSRARLGKITTAYGVINTPAFVPVATKGTLKGISPNFITDLKLQAAFVNTYHLVTHPGADIIEQSGGIHKFSQINIPLMSDSGGFQVFSLAKNHNQRRAKLRGDDAVGILATEHKGEGNPLVEKISEDGVKFRSTYDGALIEFTPEKSMEYQRKIGADLNMAFDECTYYPATHEYAEKAMNRTHEWLMRCRKYRSRYRVFSSGKKKSYLYGIIQGAMFEDLRRKSAEFVVSQQTDGVAIGGVSVGETKAEMRDQVSWVADYLPHDRPVHLLGVGQIDDIIDLVKYGIDTFDCVEPTRLARMGVFYQSKQILSRLSSTTFAKASAVKPGSAALPLEVQIQSGRSGVGAPSARATCFDFELDISKNIYKDNLSSVDESCNCYVCTNFTKAYLHHLFKQRELLGYTLATYHNLWVMEKLMETIRAAIENGAL